MLTNILLRISKKDFEQRLPCGFNAVNCKWNMAEALKANETFRVKDSENPVQQWRALVLLLLKRK